MKNCYIHIPFCTHICAYCDFPKICYMNKYTEKYLNALGNEINKIYNSEILDTIYIGGGTPSSLNINELNILFNKIKILNISPNIEFTFECNIENTTREKLEFLYKNGVNRLSFGIQTFNQKYIKLLNRYHSKEDTFKVINLAKEIGFDNINIDLIYGIPGQTIEELKEDIELFLKLDIKHISTYSLMIEKNTILNNKKYKNIDEDLEYEMYLYINKKLKENNYNQYEISNYSKKGYESKHNINYWDNNFYYGFGLGATSYINNYRKRNTKNIDKYIKGKYLLEKEYENKKIRMSNEMILGLRKTEGVNINCFNDKYKININKVFDTNKLVKEGQLILENNYLKINSKYFYISNEILLNFIIEM